MTQRPIFWHCFIGLFCLVGVEKRMSQPFDLRQFPNLPPEVVKAFEAQQAALEKPHQLQGVLHEQSPGPDDCGNLLLLRPAEQLRHGEQNGEAAHGQNACCRSITILNEFRDVPFRAEFYPALPDLWVITLGVGKSG